MNGTQWRRQRGRIGITSDEAAKLLSIAGGALRSIELGIKPASWALVYRAARLYSCEVDELLANDEGVPDGPPAKKQEQETNTGPGRKATEKTSSKGPKRLTDRGVAA